MTESLTHRAIAPRYPTGRIVQDHELLALWCAGRNTYQIAAHFGIPECEVANRLPKIRERAKQNAEWNFPEAS